MVQWFKKHPLFLVAESKALATNGNYKELFQIRDNFFVSHGEIIVRHNGTHRHPILIFYTKATPYSLPEIYPLSRRLHEEEVKQIASAGIESLSREAIKCFYEYRHQNGSGLLCILETDSLDTGSDFYGINTVIARVHSWFTAHITGDFPPDSEEVELSAHFTNLNHLLRFSYSDDFLNPSIIEGDFLGISIFRKGETGAAYFGARLNGFTSAGLWQDSTQAIHTYLQRDGFTSALDFTTKGQQLNRLLDKGDYIKGYWFDIDEEPRPFKDVEQLVQLIGNDNFDTGLQRIAKVCLAEIKDLPNQIVFAVRYSNRKGPKEFQLFTIHKKVESAGSLELDNIKRTKETLENYDIVKAVKCEKFNDESFFQRNGKRADRKILSSKNINVLGAGAIGSELADSLGKAGVGVLNIIDYQLMGVQNSVRHLGGIEQMGIPKSNAVKEIIENHNPFITVHSYPYNIKNEHIGFILPDETISISSIADDNTEGYLNEQAVLYGKEVYYVRALRGGKVARIFRVKPGEDACFYCMRLYKDDNSHFIEIPADPDYLTLRNECNNPIRPASAADLKLISSLAAGIIIGQLTNRTETNQWIWSTEAIEGTVIMEPYKLYPQTIPIHPHCPYCNDGAPVKVSIGNETLDFMKRLVAAKKGIETGGVLVGFITDEGYQITHASDAGPNAIEKFNKFEKDVEYCQAFVDDLYNQYGEKAIYLGEWHSHPNSNNRPSSIDIRSLSNIANEKNYLTTKPTMIIFSSDGDPSCTVHPAGSRYYFSKLEIEENM